MDRTRWQHVEDLLHEALAQSVSSRAAFLDRVCAGDAGLRRELESLLAHAPRSDAFLARPVALDLLVEPREDIGAAAADGGAPHDEPVLPSAIGRYRVLSRLGAGGMGVVYLAEDERLGRRVALKVLRSNSTDPRGHERLVREARVAAAISDPRICQVYELGEWNEQPFIAMELVAGDPLTKRLSEGALAPEEAVDIALAVLDALAILHAHGIVHRDLKPSNVFLTPRGVKVLDFGLARSFAETIDEAAPITHQGTIVGTPQYAAPEQLSGLAVDGRADLFSVGVILFEMLAGKPPFSGTTIAATMHAVLFDTPPALTGSAAVVALDRVLHRALAKRADDRFATAQALADELRRVQRLLRADAVTDVRRVLRLAVLPFRLLRPDSEIDYLTTSVADVLVSGLSGLESLVVRSSLASARFAGAHVDLNAIASSLSVDLVLTGSILRQGDRLRVSVELVSVPGGDSLWSETAHVAADGVFDLVEQLTRRVIASLPLGDADHSRAPASRSSNTRAYDLYLRGMQLRMESGSWRQARAFFQQSVELDPSFAPAWAERARIDRVIGKYEDPAQLARAESALVHALDLDADNGAAQHYFAQLEIDLGRVDAALARLLRRAQQRRAEPQIYAALVHACRYAGLLDASVAAHEQARHLDPQIATSVLHTWYMQRRYQVALDEAHQSSDPLESRVLMALGDTSAAIAAARREEERFAAVPLLRAFSTAIRETLEGRREAATAALQPFDGFAFNDGEGLFYVAEIYARLGDAERAFAMLDRAMNAGFFCAPAYEESPMLAGLRTDARWPAWVSQMRTRQRPLLATFARADGAAILGVALRT